jgi:hypothetical protein
MALRATSQATLKQRMNKHHKAVPYIIGKAFMIFSLVASLSLPVLAGEKMSDAEIKQKVLGYWQSPRHGYHIAPDGIIYMCPRAYATTTNHWQVKGGKFYWDNEAHTIVTLNDKKFVYRGIGRQGVTFTLIKGTKEEVDPE